MTRSIRLASLALLLFASGCHRADPPPPADAATPTLTEVRADRQDLLFRYQADGGFESVTQIEAIPEAARGAVQVVDLSRSPEARAARDFVQVFDLSKAPYQGRLVPRAALEASLIKAAPPPQAPVIMYSASWCGVCKQARAFLKAQHIAFTEKDIEADPAAGRELQAKLKAAGQAGGGVPVFDVGGQLMSGFDGPRLLKLIQGATTPAEEPR